MFPQNFEYRMRFLANEWAAALSPLLFAFGLEKLLNYDSAFSLFSFFLERSNCVSAVQGSSRYFGLSVIHFLRGPLLLFLENLTQIQYMYIHIDTCIY